MKEIHLRILRGLVQPLAASGSIAFKPGTVPYSELKSALDDALAGCVKAVEEKQPTSRISVEVDPALHTRKTRQARAKSAKKSPRGASSSEAPDPIPSDA